MSAFTRRTLAWLERWTPRPVTLLESIGVALAATAVATLLRYVLNPLIGTTVPFAPYFPALLVASLIGGTRAGFLTLTFSLVAAWLVFLGPGLDNDLWRGVLPVLVLFVSGSLIIWPAALLRHALMELTAARAAERTLMSEINHRVKNIYSVVLAMSTQTARGAKSLEDYMQRFSSRLQALANTQNVLVSHTTDGAHMSEVVRAALGPFADSRSDQVSIAGPEVYLGSQSCVSLTLALHELSTNAMKYGALLEASGRIDVSWQFEPAMRKLSFVWRETGVPHVASPERKGFGTRLIEQTFAQESDRRVEMKYLPGGLVCEMSCTLKT
jgi:two-component sensor histidine kinase